jgi:hypothetical protein
LRAGGERQEAGKEAGSQEEFQEGALVHKSMFKVFRNSGKLFIFRRWEMEDRRWVVSHLPSAISQILKGFNRVLAGGGFKDIICN